MSHNPEDCAVCKDKDICDHIKAESEVRETIREVYRKYGATGLSLILSAAVLDKTENEVYVLLKMVCREMTATRKTEELATIITEVKGSAENNGRVKLLEEMLEQIHKGIVKTMMDMVTKSAKEAAVAMGVEGSLEVLHVTGEELQEVMGKVMDTKATVEVSKKTLH